MTVYDWLVGTIVFIHSVDNIGLVNGILACRCMG